MVKNAEEQIDSCVSSGPPTAKRKRRTFKCRCQREVRLDKSSDKGSSRLCNRCISAGDAQLVVRGMTKRPLYHCIRCKEKKRADKFPKGKDKRVCLACLKKDGDQQSVAHEQGTIASMATTVGHTADLARPERLSLQDLDMFMVPEDTSEVLTPMAAMHGDSGSELSDSKSTIFGRAPSECFATPQCRPRVTPFELQRQVFCSSWSWLLLQLQFGNLVQLPNGRVWKKSLLDALHGRGPIFGPNSVPERCEELMFFRPVSIACSRRSRCLSFDLPQYSSSNLTHWRRRPGSRAADLAR